MVTIPGRSLPSMPEGRRILSVLSSTLLRAHSEGPKRELSSDRIAGDPHPRPEHPSEAAASRWAYSISGRIGKTHSKTHRRTWGVLAKGTPKGHRAHLPIWKGLLRRLSMDWRLWLFRRSFGVGLALIVAGGGAVVNAQAPVRSQRRSRRPRRSGLPSNSMIW